MKVKSGIPNAITLSNLICGMLSVYALYWGELGYAALLILLGAFFDFFDGLAARALNVSGELGKQLDSLADVVTFGVAPAFIALHLMGGMDALPVNSAAYLWYFTPFIMAACAGLRLARFNIDTRQSDRFIGLPTPAVALFWVSLALVALDDTNTSMLGALYVDFMAQPWALAAACVLLAGLMLAPIPLIALKFKGYSLAANGWRYALMLCAVVLLAFFAVKAIPIVLLLYIALSAAENLQNRKDGIQSSN